MAKVNSVPPGFEVIVIDYDVGGGRATRFADQPGEWRVVLSVPLHRREHAIHMNQPHEFKVMRVRECLAPSALIDTPEQAAAYWRVQGRKESCAGN